MNKLRSLQDHLHELLIGHLNPPVSVGIGALKGFSQGLHHDTTSDKAIKGYPSLTVALSSYRAVFSLEHLEEVRGKSKPKLFQTKKT